MSDLTHRIDSVAVDVTALELRLKDTQDELKRAEVRLDHDGRRMLLVKLDGSIENAPLQASPGPRKFERTRLRTDYSIEPVFTAHGPVWPINSHSTWHETFCLIGQVGKLYIYGEV